MRTQQECIRLSQFDRDIKTLRKKYRSAEKDIRAVENLLLAGSGDEALRAQQVRGFGDRVAFFVSGNDTKRDTGKLWVSDGTPAGTRQVHDLNPSGRGSIPREMVEVGDRLFFVGETLGVGWEVFVFDGAEPVPSSIMPKHVRPATRPAITETRARLSGLVGALIESIACLSNDQ